MILTGKKIANNVRKNKIVIDPFDIKQLTTNSYDLKLAEHLLIYEEQLIDPKKQSKKKLVKIPKNGYLLKAKKFYLACSLETIGSNHYVPIIHAKSGIARLGLFVHVTADLIDIGFKGKTTFQLFPVNDIYIYPGMLIGQVSFWKPIGKIEIYNGKYNNAILPIESRIFEDFNK